jgi:hypothetical protein
LRGGIREKTYLPRGSPEIVAASPIHRTSERRIPRDPDRAASACKEAHRMELAAVVLFSSVVLWFVEETTDEHI